MNVENRLRGFLCGCRALLTPPQGLRRADMIAVGCIMAACFFLFQFGDLDYASSFSYAYLEGHFLDFYHYNKATFSAVPGYYYLQPIFLLFAAWNLPLKLFGLTGHAAQGEIKLSTAELAWGKLLLVVFLALCSVVIYRIARLIVEEDGPAKLCMFLFLTNPLTIYTIFIFGGFDIFSLAFMMLGLYAFLRNKRWQFILWFAFAIPFKYFALIPFLPLLLLDEKNVWKILRSLFVAAAPTLVCLAFSLLDPGGADGEALRQLGTLRFFALEIGPMMKPAIFVLAYLGICLFAHFKCADGRQRQKYAVLLPLAATSLIFVCMAWNAQWVILITPWLALAFLFNPNKTYSLLFGTLGSAAFFIRIFCGFSWLASPIANNFLVDPSLLDANHLYSFLGNFWVSSSAGYGVVRGFFQAGIVGVSALLPQSLVPYAEAVILICLLSPFLLSLLQRKEAVLPTPRLFKTENGYLRMYCYGGLAAYLLPIAAVSAVRTWIPGLFDRLVAAIAQTG